jgi:hypothetical protein
LRQSTRELVCWVGGHEQYAVDLDRCQTATAVLDWVCQVGWKLWATPEIVGWLVKAINDTVDPQARLCSFGMMGGVPRRPAHRNG